VIVEFDKSFLKSLDKIKDRPLFPKIEKAITILESSTSLSEIKAVKKLTGFKSYYRYRIGEYRIGIELMTSSTVRLVLISHRKDIYKGFP